jgi:hypothetical protein
MQSGRMLPTFWRVNKEKNEAASGPMGDGGPTKLGPNFWGKGDYKELASSFTKYMASGRSKFKWDSEKLIRVLIRNDVSSIWWS